MEEAEKREERAKPEQKTAQVRIRRNNVVMGYPEGTVLWLTPSMARMLHAKNCIDIIGFREQGPTEIKDSRTIEAPKFLGTPLNGPSTASPSSSVPGKGAPPSSSGAAPASQTTSAGASGEPNKQPQIQTDPYAPLRSTTRIPLRHGRTSSTSQTTGGGNGTGTKRNSGRSRG